MEKDNEDYDYADSSDYADSDEIPTHLLITLVISLWGIMSLCLCTYTHLYIWRDPLISKLCMYVVLCSLVMFFGTIFAFKPDHVNDGWYYGSDSNWRRFNKRSYERWKRENGEVKKEWVDYRG